MKNASRNKFLLCFRPVVDMDQLILEPKKGDIVRSKNRALACASMDRKEILRRSMSNSALSDYSTTSGLILHSANTPISKSMRVSDRESLRQDPPKIPKRSFSMRRKKSLDITKDLSSVNSIVIKTRDFSTNNSSVSPSSSSESSSTSGSIPLSEPNSEREVKTESQKTKKNMKCEIMKAENLDRTGIYLVLVSLAVTVFWGKAFAIIFTSLWLYFLPSRHTRNSVRRPEHVLRVAEKKESNKENKKRVIIEGLLERNHQRISNRWGGALNI